MALDAKDSTIRDSITQGQTGNHIGSHRNAKRTSRQDPEGERRVRQSIERAAARNATLLSDLMATGDAPGLLTNAEVRQESLKTELSVQVEATQTASLTTEKYARDRNSFALKWYYLLTSKILRQRNRERETRTEDRLYYEALATLAKAERRTKELQQDIDAVEQEKVPLAAQAKKHAEVHKAIDDLYETIFAGPTPGFPDEDEREDARQTKKGDHNATAKTLVATVKAVKNVNLIKLAIKKAKTESENASQESDSLLFSFGTTSLWVERCLRFLDRARQLALEAKEALPKPLGNDFQRPFQVLDQSLRSAQATAVHSVNLVFPSREEIKRDIRQIEANLTAAAEAQEQLYTVTKTAERVARQAIQVTARALEDARQSLQEIRQGAFEVTVGFGAAAPPYHECCDRAEGFEGEVMAQCQRIPVPTVDDINLPPPPNYEQATETGETRRTSDAVPAGGEAERSPAWVTSPSSAEAPTTESIPTRSA